MKPQGAGVLYLSQDKLQLYSSLVPDIINLPFPPNAVHNHTVANPEQLQKAVTDFITTHNLQPTTLILVIADNASFITDKKQEDLTENEKTFQEEVPFNQTTIRTLHVPGRTYLYATNQTLYETIKKAFEEKGFVIEFILPGIVFKNSLSSQPSLTLELASTIFRDALSLKRYSLLNSQTVMDEEEKAAFKAEKVYDSEQRKHDILRLYAYSTIFGVLLLTLVVLVNVVTSPQTYKGKAREGQNVLLQQSTQETKQLSILIANGLSDTGTATELKRVLSGYEFKSIIMQNQTITKKQNLLVFSNRPSLTVRTAILTEVQKYLPDITVIDNPTAVFDITIILAK